MNERRGGAVKPSHIGEGLVRVDVSFASFLCAKEKEGNLLLCLTNYYVKKMKDQKKNIWGMVLQATIGILSAIAAALGLQSCGFGV